MVNYRRENIREQHTGPFGTGQHAQTDVYYNVKIKSQGFYMTLHQPALVDQLLIEHACLEVSLMSLRSFVSLLRAFKDQAAVLSIASVLKSVFSRCLNFLFKS